MAVRKSFFSDSNSSRSSSNSSRRSSSNRNSDDATQTRDDTRSSTRQKGDLDGDGDVDWVDKLLECVMFMQTPKGQSVIIIAAAVFSAAINMSTYTKSIGLFLTLVKASWLIPFAWLIGFLVWALIQVFETLPRTGFWDFDTKVAILKTLNGLHIPVISNTKGKQTDILYWQDVAVNDAKIRRQMFWGVSIAAHILDLMMLWADFPIGKLSPFTINWINVGIAGFMIFSFEILVGLAMSLRQFRIGYAQPSK